MEQKSNYLKSEQELRDKQDELYKKTIEGIQQKGQSPGHKDLLETPYTESGRQIYMNRTDKKPLKVRADELLSLNWSKIIKIGHKEKLYNFEYFMNRAYTFNRDKGRCRVCKEVLEGDDIHIHHINPNYL